MIRNIKALGLAFVAVAAMSMAAAAAAQASELHVTTSEEKAAITGSQTTQHVFQITPAAGPKTTCEQALFEGTVQRAGAGQQITANELTITPTYTGCKSFGVNAQIKLNGCKYTITSQNQSTPNPHTTALTSWVDITGCTTITGQQNHQQIEVITAGCTIKVPQQHHLSHLVFQNTPEPQAVPHDVIVHATVSGIAYQVQGALCGHTTGVTTNDGTYHGTATFRAFKDEGTVHAEHNGHTYQKIVDNLAVQYGLLAT